jgi:Tfp pilus assembly PilM family ATPase
MARDLIAGIGVAEGCAHLSLFERREDHNTLLHLQEYVDTTKDPFWFLEPILQPKSRWLRKVSSVSVALESSSLVFHQFPMDTSLSQPEQTEHVHWELGNFVREYQPKDYVSEVHVLQTNTNNQTADMMVVAAKRAWISQMEEMLGGRGCTLEIADAEYFGAEYALLVNYPETRGQRVALALVADHRVDVGIEDHGRLVKYGYALEGTAGAIVKMLKEQLFPGSLAGVYLCGPAVSQETTASIKESLGIRTSVLNPFLQEMKTSSFRGYDVFIGLEHRFASCVGIGLRRR